MKTITLEACQQRALGQYLCQWPENKSYKEIIEAMENDDLMEDENEDETISIWEAVEDYDPSGVAEMIEDYYSSICRFVGLEPDNA
jgi:hypothetical protein